MHMKVSHSVRHHVKLIFSRTEPNIVAGDKLSIATNPGFLKSEENVKLHTFIYTKSVSENICVYDILFQHFGC